MQRRMTWLALLSAAIVMTALYNARTVQATQAVINVHSHDRGCSVASLKRDLCLAQDGREQCRGWPYRRDWHRRL
jgi:hypothetical protein